ncbi:MAG: hypothetical protein HJJLKODD_02144 [Phycisphaerae bacterium]|nr:hypothetical protein [Phycisphaerae bacterium]
MISILFRKAMYSSVLPVRPLLSERLGKWLGVGTFTLLIALAAQLKIYLPVTPVPVTMQDLMVLLAGGILGAWRGVCCLAWYVVLGALGWPVFAGGAAGFWHLLGPTGGYLVGFILAAGISGWIIERHRTIWSVVTGMALGYLAIFICGVGWLTFLTGDLEKSLLIGYWPFALASVYKMIIVSTLCDIWRRRVQQ